MVGLNLGFVGLMECNLEDQCGFYFVVGMIGASEFRRGLTGLPQRLNSFNHHHQTGVIDRFRMS